MSYDPARFAGSIPEHYDVGLGPVIFVDYAADIARRTAGGKPTRRVLETAAGTGIVTRALRDALPAQVEITSTDLNAPMLDVARSKFDSAEKVAFEAADATALPYADGHFDAVVCQFGIMFFPDQAKGHREAHRVLSPGGRYLFSVWDEHAYNGFARVTNALVLELFPQDPPRFYSVPFSSNAIDPIKQSLLEANFDEINVHVLGLKKSVADLSLFARGLVFGNPLIDEITARGTTSPEDVHAALVERLRAEFGAEPCDIPLQTILYTARKPPRG